MSFLTKIKSLFKDEEKAEKPAKVEIPFEQIASKLEDKIKELNEKEISIKSEVNSNLSEFNKNLIEKIAVLEVINLADKKEHEKLKLIVQENLNLYISQTKRMLLALESTEDKKIKDYLQNLAMALNKFNHESSQSYEKATILIGKEIGETRRIIWGFSKDIQQALNGNAKSLEEADSSERLSWLFEELKQNAWQSEEIESKITGLNFEIKKENERISEAEKGILKIKESDEYKADQEEKEKIKEIEQNIDKKLLEIKQKIELKALARIFYKDKKRAQLIKDYSANFKQALKNDEKYELIDMANEAGHDKAGDLSVLKDISKELIRLKEKELAKTDRQIASLEENLKKINYEISNLKSDLSDELKRKEKLALKADNLKEEIKELSKNLFNAEIT